MTTCEIGHQMAHRAASGQHPTLSPGMPSASNRHAAVEGVNQASPAVAVPQYVTSRDAAALLGVPEPEVRQLIRDGTLAGFRAEGYWIASGAAVARYAASAEGALARLRTDFRAWRIGALSSGYFAIADGAPEAGRAAVFTARTVDGLRRELDGPQTDAAHRRPRRRSAPAATRSPPRREVGLP